MDRSSRVDGLAVRGGGLHADPYLGISQHPMVVHLADNSFLLCRGRDWTSAWLRRFGHDLAIPGIFTQSVELRITLELKAGIATLDCTLYLSCA